MGGGKIFCLGFDQGNRNRLGVGVYLDPEGIIEPPFRFLCCLPLNDLDSTRGFFPANNYFFLPSRVDGGGDEVCSGIRFAQRAHIGAILIYPLILGTGQSEN